MASSTFSGSPVTVTQLGSGAPLCGKRMSTWKEHTQQLRWLGALHLGSLDRRLMVTYGCEWCISSEVFPSNLVFRRQRSCRYVRAKHNTTDTEAAGPLWGCPSHGQGRTPPNVINGTRLCPLHQLKDWELNVRGLPSKPEVRSAAEAGRPGARSPDRVGSTHPIAPAVLLGLHPFTAGLGTHLEFIHDFADGFATGANDAGVNAVVQWDVLRNHLFKFTHNFQYGVPGSFCILFIPCDGNLVLGLRKEKPVRRGDAPRDPRLGAPTQQTQFCEMTRGSVGERGGSHLEGKGGPAQKIKKAEKNVRC